jgi:lysylphosphatidylglycerol synthetase-like protein (DUF2156 family)
MTSKLRSKLSIIGAVLLMAPFFAGASVLAADADINNSLCAGSNVQITANPGNDSCSGDNLGKPVSTANKLITDVVNIISALVGAVAVIMIIFAGFRYVTSGGRDDAVKGAKNTILYAIIGLVIVALAQIIVHFVLAKTTDATTTSSSSLKVAANRLP